jgi:hypothetical protein
MPGLYLTCSLCGRRQAHGLLSAAAWRRLGLGIEGEPLACPSCVQDPDWQERLAAANAVSSETADRRSAS